LKSRGVRLGHTLIVPYCHRPVTKFTADLVPEDQVRELKPSEGKWEFWTSSPAFAPTMPKTRGVVSVPIGESWVVERLGSYNRTLQSGVSFILPFVESVKSVKNTTLSSLGFISTEINTPHGLFDAYAVLHYKVADASISTYYVDPETNKQDSERAASRILRKALSTKVLTLSSTALSAADKEKLGEEILEGFKKDAGALGLSAEKVEIRGVFPQSQQVPQKLRAYEYPAVDLDGPGHDLEADYWTEVLSPPYFQKMKYGSSYVPVTPITPSMEWNIPSPPDFHHFNMQPKVTVAPEEEELKKMGKPTH